MLASAFLIGNNNQSLLFNRLFLILCVPISETQDRITRTKRETHMISSRKASPRSLLARIATLRQRHRALDARILDEERRPMPDMARLKPSL